MTTYVRKNVYENGGDFSDPTLLWYARGVAAMNARPITDPTSWRFFAAIHGIDKPLWIHYGYLSRTEQLPAQSQINLFWDQCQHGTWYFLPWHRGYLLALEATIRAAVVGAGGPSDWALPYWNYFDGNENVLPPAFASRDWPDGTGNNPLFIPQRWGPTKAGNQVYVPVNQVNMDALGDPDFIGPAQGASVGFGGIDTGFSHGGNVFGGIESQPHNLVHVFVGGQDPQNPRFPGLMSYPPSAALDPIFYLHHANIDRLWQTWLQEPASTGNPTDPNWLNGPASIGERAFAMPMPPSGAPWYYTPGDVGNLSALDYMYDDLSPNGAPAVTERLEMLRAAAGATEGANAMPSRSQNVEMVGANEAPLHITGRGGVHTQVRLEGAARNRMTANLAAAAPAEAAPATASDRVFLNLENVRSPSDAHVLQVYVNLPDGADPADHPDRLAGSVGLFGARQASEPDQAHGGAGLTFVMEITHVVNALHLGGELDAGALDVRIVPFDEVPEEVPVTVGRVSMFRQGR